MKNLNEVITKIYSVFIKVWAQIVSIIPHHTVIIDTETTDKSPYSAELLQVTLINSTGRVLFNRFIKPDTAESWESAQKINHISPGMVKHCMSISVYKPLINAYLKHTKKIIGFNLDRFDLQVLSNYGIYTNAKSIDIMKKDSKIREEKGLGDRWRKLTVVARNYGYLFIPHDALTDCFATLHIYSLMLPGLHTALYFLKKILLFVAGGIGLSLVLKGNALFGIDPVYIGFYLIGLIAFIYGPIIGMLSSILGIILFNKSALMMLSLCCAAVFLGVIYQFVKSPKPVILKILLCFLASFLGYLLGICILQGGVSFLKSLSSLNAWLPLLRMLSILSVSSVLYFIIGRFIQRII